MNRKLEKWGIAFLMAFSIIHLPFYVGSKLIQKKEGEKTFSVASPKMLFQSHCQDVYETSGLSKAGLDFDIFYKAVLGYYNLKREGKVANQPVLSVVDFRKASTEKRLFIVDLRSKKLLFHTLVSHGKNSGDNYATTFSNKPNSLMSSIGFYTTDATYHGKHGLSLALNGWDKGFNDKARERAVVMHAADYTDDAVAKKLGRIGRSWGCPAVPAALSNDIISLVQGGSCLFLYYPDKNYEKSSKFLQEDSALQEFQAESLTAMN